MSESAAFARRTMKGGCNQARIPAGLASGAVGVITADALSSWVGAVANGPTRAMLDIDGSAEEIEITAVSGNTFTIPAGGRGLQGTADTTHLANVTIDIIGSPRDLDEANRLVNAILGISGLTAGDLLYLLSSTTFQRLAKGTARQQLAMNSGATAPEWVASLQSLLTTQGDIPYASAANTPTRLAKGTALQVLRMNAAATGPEWAAPASSVAAFSGALMKSSADQTITNGNSDVLDLDAEDKDTDAYHGTSGVYTCAVGKAGVHHFSCNVGFTPGATVTGDLEVYGRKNGGATRLGGFHARSGELTASVKARRSFSFSVELAEGDTVEMAAFNNVGSSVVFASGDVRMDGHLIGTV